MSDRPFMQLYVSDFVGDTLLLSTEHIGAYLLLLIALWNADGSLPSDEVKLARVTRLTVKKWRRVAVDLLPFFEVQNGTLTHHRLTKELRKSEAQSNSRAMAGAKGGAANALKYKRPVVAGAQAGLKHAGASPEPYRKEGAQALLDPTDGLVVLAEETPDFKAIVAYRKGKRPIIGKSGATTVTAEELFMARAAYGLQAHTEAA